MKRKIIRGKNKVRIILILVLLVTMLSIFNIRVWFRTINQLEDVLLVYNEVENLDYRGTYNISGCKLYLTAAHMGSKGDREVLYNPYGFLICIIEDGVRLAPFVKIEYDFAFDLYKEGELMESKHVRFIKTDGNIGGSVIRIFETIYGLGDYTLRYSGTISGPAKVTIDGEKYFSIVGEPINKWD